MTKHDFVKKLEKKLYKEILVNILKWPLDLKCYSFCEVLKWIFLGLCKILMLNKLSCEERKC